MMGFRIGDHQFINIFGLVHGANGLVMTWPAAVFWTESYSNQHQYKKDREKPIKEVAQGRLAFGSGLGSHNHAET